MQSIKNYILTLYKNFLQFTTSEGVLIWLFLLRACYIFVPETPLPNFPEMSYRVAVFFIFLALIELNIIYLLHKKYKNTLTELFCWIAGGHLIQQFTLAAITPSYSEVVWVLVCIVYIFWVWKKKR